MPQISLRNISFSYSGAPLLDDISIEIEKGERIGLVGRNGAGKSTLMKIVVGDITPDDGEVRTSQGLRVARLVQEVPDDTSGTIAEIVRSGMSGLLDDWQIDTAVETVLTRMALDPDSVFSTLSSGMKRRALLARALVEEPDILLLDEPTNHLDIDSITWLERFLKAYGGTLLFVTHDRVFLQALATRIIEVDRGKLFDWTCDYETFLKRKLELLSAEEKNNAHFDRKLAEEEKWIRKGIKARRTRNEGRVRELKKMRQERSDRRSRVGNVNMAAATADKSGRMVIEAKGVNFAYDKEPIVQGLTSTIMRGDKVGIIGPNGAGKSTLLKLLLGDLQPKSGSIRHGTKLEVIYFDQLREQIDEEKTVVENVSEGQDMLELNGSQVHIYGYLQNFLFTPERARRPARFLSGGERNRLLLARLFKKPSNLMVLDEPTNDLDAETLELLEELVASYDGTLLLVSHDRAFINNVVTSTLVFDGKGNIDDYDGGYDDYLRQRAIVEPKAEAKTRVPKTMTVEPQKKKKLGFKEQRELDELPERIEKLEKEQSELNATMAAPDFYKEDANTITKATERAAKIEDELLHCLERWEDLGSRG